MAFLTVWWCRSYYWFTISAIELFILIGLLLWSTSLPRSLVGDSNCLSLDGQKDICYCEAFVASGPFKELSNSLSGLSFSAVGIAIALALGVINTPTPINRMTSDMTFPLAYAFLAVFLGPGSMMFHSQLSSLGGFFDTFSMYNWLGWVVAYDIIRIFNFRNRQSLILLGLYVGVVASFTIVQQIIVESLPKGNGGNLVFAALVVLAAVCELGVLFSNRGYNQWSAWAWIVGGVAVFLAALGIWFLSQTGNVLCFPHARLQGHAVWHAMSACTVGMVFVYLWQSPDRPDHVKSAHYSAVPPV